jgi:hypothetical protein
MGGSLDGSCGRRGYNEYPGDPRPSKPGKSEWMLKADRGGRRILCTFLFSNYYSYLTEQNGNSAGGMAGPNGSSSFFTGSSSCPLSSILCQNWTPS